MNADPQTAVDRWNDCYPIGTPVIAYPGVRPADDPTAEHLTTRTRSQADVLGGHTAVVWVDGHSACIALTHVDPVQSADAYVPPAQYVRSDGVDCCPHATPVGPGSCEYCWELVKWDAVDASVVADPVPAVGGVVSAAPTQADDAEPVCKFDGGCHRVVACEPGCKTGAELMHTRLNAAAADRAALRDRIAEALMRWAEGNNDPQYARMRRSETVRANAYSRADAVLAVLPPPADRASVLLEVADFLRGLRATRTRVSVRDIETDLREQAAAARRVADEAQQPGIQRCPSCGHHICDGDGPCGALLGVTVTSENRCGCTGPGTDEAQQQPDTETPDDEVVSEPSSIAGQHLLRILDGPEAQPDCLACRHWSCDGDGPCGAVVSASERCTCTGPAVVSQPGKET